MRNKRWLILLIVGFLLIPFNVLVPDASGEIWENEYGKLEIYPDVSTGIITQVQYCNLTSYVDDVEIDVTFRFDIQIGNPDIWIWRNMSHWVSVPDYGMIQSNFTLVNISDIVVIPEPEFVDFGDIPSVFYRQGTACHWDGVEWWNGTFNVGFDSMEWLNPEHTEARFYYEYYGVVGSHLEEQYWFDWDNIKSLFSHVEHEGKHHYYIRSWMIKDQLYQFKWSYDVPLGSDGKWDLMAKLSSDPLGTWRVSIDPWWDSDWSYYKMITIESDYIATDLTYFPVLVNSTDAAMIAKCDGGDSVRFLSLDNSSEFAYQIEEWNPGDFTIHVNISETLTSGSDYQFLMYYGNAGASDNQNPSGVWDSNYIAVWHMNNLTDSTSYNVDLTNSGASSGAVGKVGSCYDFEDSEGDYMYHATFLDNMPSSDSLTVEIWTNFEQDNSENNNILGKSNDDGVNRFVCRRLVSNGLFDLYAEAGNDGGHSVQTTEVCIDSVWYYLSFIYDADVENKIKHNDSGLVVDGETIGAIGDGSDGNFQIARWTTGTAHFDGLLDEIRISDSVRNESWLNASFHSQNQSSHLGSFLSWGSEQTAPPGVNPPTISSEYPTNESVDITLFPVLGATIADADVDSMNITWYSNVSGSWVVIGTNLSDVYNGTYYQKFDDFGIYGLTYWWNVSVTDGTYIVDSGVFSFTAESTPSASGGGGMSSNSGVALALGVAGGLLGGMVGVVMHRRRREG